MRTLAFGGYYCGCTVLAATLDDVPRKCPVHERPLVARASWELAADGAELGLQPGPPINPPKV